MGQKAEYRLNLDEQIDKVASENRVIYGHTPGAGNAPFSILAKTLRGPFGNQSTSKRLKDTLLRSIVLNRPSPEEAEAEVRRIHAILISLALCFRARVMQNTWPWGTPTPPGMAWQMRIIPITANVLRPLNVADVIRKRMGQHMGERNSSRLHSTRAAGR